MTEEFKKWLCKLIEEEQQFDGYYQDPDCVDSLVKAMWAINREGKYVIRQYRTLFNIWISGNPKEIFYFKNKIEYDEDNPADFLMSTPNGANWDKIKNNGASGHVCLHFIGSLRHKDKLIDDEAQKCI